MYAPGQEVTIQANMKQQFFDHLIEEHILQGNITDYFTMEKKRDKLIFTFVKKLEYNLKLLPF